MVAELGLAQLTLAGLAGRLGVKQPSLYKHIASIAELRRGVAILALDDLGGTLLRAAAGRSGADAVVGMSRAYRDWALENPALYEASQLMPTAGDEEHEAATLAVVDTVANVLVAYGLDGDDSVDAIRAFRSMLHGFVTFEAMGSFAMSADVNRSFERMVHGFTVALAQWKTPATSL